MGAGLASEAGTDESSIAERVEIVPGNPTCRRCSNTRWPASTPTAASSTRRQVAADPSRRRLTCSTRIETAPRGSLTTAARFSEGLIAKLGDRPEAAPAVNLANGPGRAGRVCGGTRPSRQQSEPQGWSCLELALRVPRLQWRRRLPARCVVSNLLRTEPAQVAVASGAIVEALDVVGHTRDGQCAVLVALPIDSLLLEAVKNDSATALSQQSPLRLTPGSRRCERQKLRQVSLPNCVPWSE